MNDPYTLHTLANGLRVVIEHMPEVNSAAAGFLSHTGARDETPALAGVSHFLEHMCFKGTAKRDWHQISVDFDKLGSIYNAFTSADRTFYFGWVPKGSIREQIEVLADMMRPALPEEEFATEKKVILEEIAMSKDSVDHVAFDFVLERVFEGHPLGWPVLGYEKTVGDLTRDQLHDYFQERYAADNMTLIVAGNVDPAEIIGLAERYCGEWASAPDPPPRTVPPLRTGRAVRQIDRFKQQIVALAYPAPSADDPLNETAAAAATILGGSNSRFYWNIVQTGLSADASCYRVPFCDSGLTLLWGQTDPERAEELAEAMQTEARRMRTKGVDGREVQRVKNKRRTGLALEAEAPYHRLVQIMDDVDLRGQPRTVQQRLAAVDAITAPGIAEYFERYPIDGEGFLVSVGPRDWPR